MQQFFSDGFTAENLSKITGVSADLISRCAHGETLSHNEIMDMGIVLDSLCSLYMVDTGNPGYLKECITVLEQYFNLPHIAIANYLELTELTLNSFLNNPVSYENGYELSLKLMHLRTIFMQRQGN